MSQNTPLLEFSPISKADKVDEEAGIIYDLVMWGPTSERGRDYPESTMRNALPLLEGLQCIVDHVVKPGEEPSVHNVLGIWRAPRVVDGKTRGNLHYFKAHPISDRLVEAAKRPDLHSALGFSLNARGNSRREGNRDVVESITSVRSVDLVYRGATTASLFESAGGNTTVTTTVRKLIESLKSRHPKQSACLLEMAEAGLMSPDASMEAPAGAGADDHSASFIKGIQEAIGKVLMGDMDWDAKIEQINAYLKTMKKHMGKAETKEEKPAETAEEGPAKESAEWKAKLAKSELQLKARDLCEDAGVKPDPILRKALSACSTETEVKELIESAKGAPARTFTQVRSVERKPAKGEGETKKLQESAKGTAEIPTAPKDCARWLRNGK